MGHIFHEPHQFLRFRGLVSSRLVPVQMAGQHQQHLLRRQVLQHLPDCNAIIHRTSVDQSATRTDRLKDLPAPEDTTAVLLPWTCLEDGIIAIGVQDLTKLMETIELNHAKHIGAQRSDLLQQDLQPVKSRRPIF